MREGGIGGLYSMISVHVCVFHFTVTSVHTES